MKKVVILFIILIIAFPIICDEFAKTKDGKVVILHDNGTWELTDKEQSDLESEDKKNTKDENKETVAINNIQSLSNKVLLEDISFDKKFKSIKINFKNGENDFSKFIFQTLNNEVTITLIKLKYGDDTEKKVSDNFTLYTKEPIKMLEIKKAGGSTNINEMRIDLKAEKEVSTETRIKIYGVK